MNPEDTRDCDGFPGLRRPVETVDARIKAILAEAGIPIDAWLAHVFSGDVAVRACHCPCGDAGDCGELCD